jgi:ABC-type antimicrobial peptide transport system permease subunit
MVWRQAMRPVIRGTIVGLALAWASTRFLRGKVLGLTALDPLVVFAATILMVLIASVACYLPARRASRLSPAASLRAD